MKSRSRARKKAGGTQRKKHAAPPGTKSPRRLAKDLRLAEARLEQEIKNGRRLAKKLAHEQNVLRALMDTLPDTIYFKDTSCRFVRVNKEHARVLGIDNPRAAIGKTDFDFMPAPQARETSADEKRILETGEALIGKIENRTRHGKERWISTTKMPVRDSKGHITGIVGLSRDITNLRAMEEALDKERILMKALMDNIPDAIFFKDPQSRFIAINRYCAKKFGLKNPEDAVGITDFDIFTEEHARQAFEDEQNVIRTGTPIVGLEEKETWPDKADTWVSTTKMPLRDKKGRVVGTCGMARDVTVVRNYRDALQEAKQLLEKRVEDRTTDLREANRRLELRLDQLDFLTRATYKLAQVSSLADLFPAITNAFLSRFKTVEGCLCARDREELRCVYATHALDSAQARASAEKAIADLANKRLRTPIMYRDWTKDKHLGDLTWNGVRDLPCYIIVPLLAESELLGCVQMFTKADYAERFEHEKPLLATLGSHAAMCQSNGEYYREVGVKARLEGELEAARNIQKSFTPSEKPSIPNVRVQGFYQPAYEVSGDYLDYFQTTDGSWVIVIADVCGKGIPAALLMTVLRSAFRTEAQRFSDAKEIVCAVDESMRKNLDERSFVTALCLLLTRDGSKMSYVRAGHPKLIKLGPNGNEPVHVDSAGLALGLVRDSGLFSEALQVVTIPLQSGDRFLVYTDGLVEALDSKMKTYGIERLSALLKRTSSHDPDTILSAILDDVKAFTNDTPFHDDLTMLALTVG